MGRLTCRVSVCKVWCSASPHEPATFILVQDYRSKCRSMFNRTDSNVSVMDRLGLFCLGLLLLSPLIFKVRLAGDVAVHPFTPLLLAAWGWTLWAAFEAVRQGNGPSGIEWRIVTPPVLLTVLVTVGLAGSLAFNSLKLRSWQSGGWLLLAKGLLYVAPLPFTALLVVRSGMCVMKLLNCMIPTVALLTLVYSFYRFVQDPAVSSIHARSESEARYFAMGTFGEVISGDGLILRTDTVGQGAYGMYLVLVMAFSIALAFWRGMDAGLPRWYTRCQAWVLCPAALLGVLYTGSRTSLLLLGGVTTILLVLLVSRLTGALTQGHLVRAGILLIVALVAVVGVRQYVPVSFPALHRLGETVTDQFEIRQSALGSFSPVTNEPRKSAVRNVESRVWLWGKTVRYMMDHPLVLLTGIGNDRKRFLEEIVGLPYDGDHVHFQTAHNLFLDILVKGGAATLAVLVAGCVWFLRLAVKAVTINGAAGQSRAVIGIGLVLLSFWPPFVLVNLLGEEMFTDNLQLHWTVLFGLLLGLMTDSKFGNLSGKKLERISSSSSGGVHSSQ